MNSSKNRSTLLGVIGAYLIYLAYQLFESRLDADTTMTPAARIIFMILFSLSGIALVIYAVRIWRKSDQEDDEKKQDEDINALK